MIRVGVVGPMVSVENILKTGKEFLPAMSYIPFPYKVAFDIPDIIKAHDHEVDQWFFSGPLGYEYACKHLGRRANFSYCMIIGAGFYQSCLEVAATGKSLINSISVDIFCPSLMAQSVRELSKHLGQIYGKEYSVDFTIDELVDFHLKLWEEGKIVGAFSSIYAVAEVLQKKGVPAFFTTLSTMEIYQSLFITYELVQNRYFKSSQVGRMILEIADFNSWTAQFHSPYELQDAELTLQKRLLPIGQLLDGFLIKSGNGRFEIFTSRGLIEQNIGKIEHHLNLLSQEFQITLLGGVGFGATSFTAELNASKGLHSCKQGIVIVDENGKISEGNRESKISYTESSKNLFLLEKLEEANVSIRTYQKIKAITEQLGGNRDFSADQIAKRMGVTERNIRRILSGLLRANLVEIAGKVAAGRGRPTQLYRFTR
jgi:Predicted transcriptional regulator